MFSGLEQVGNRKVSPDDFVREIDYVNKALTGKNKSMVIHHLKDFLTGQDNIPNKKTLFHKTLSKIDPEKADKLIDSVARLVHTVALVLTDETLDLSPEEKAKIMSNINFMPEMPDPRSEEDKKLFGNSYLNSLPRDVLRSVILPYVTEGNSDANTIEQTNLVQAYPYNSRDINQVTQLDLKSFSSEEEFLAALDKHGENVTNLNLDNTGETKSATGRIVDFLYRNTLRKCPNLKKLNVAYSAPAMSSVQDLIPWENIKVEELSISNSAHRDSYFSQTFNGFTPLKSLQVIKFKNITNPGRDFFDNLLSLPNLKSLTLLSSDASGTPFNFIHSVKKLTTSRSTLESLTLSGSLPTLVLEITLPNLTTLNLSGTVYFEELMKLAESNNFPNLKVLTIGRDLYVGLWSRIDTPFQLTEEQKEQITKAFSRKRVHVEFSNTPFE